MRPLICFYKNNNYVVSSDYIVIVLKDSVFGKLQEYQKTDQLKILQIDFEGQSGHLFILNQFEILSAEDLNRNYPHTPWLDQVSFTPQITKNQFIEKILKIKSDIQNGRYYQVNFTSRYNTKNWDQISSLSSENIFWSGQNCFRSRFPAFLPLSQDEEILCYSPELFLKKEKKIVTTEPIKGTALSKNTEDLIQSDKESAELSMIVDLLRNDLNTVCEKPVQVLKHREVMDLGYTKHTYSIIEGQSNLSVPEILKKVLPAGSVSGCPKMEACKAIHELEDSKRGFYTGIIGWWQNDDCCFNVTIRSFLKRQNQLTYFAGCGIVYDSNPENEWTEFLMKASKLRIEHE